MNMDQIIVYRNTWLGNEKLFLIINLIINIILDHLKKTVQNLFTITTNIPGCVLLKKSSETFK